MFLIFLTRERFYSNIFTDGYADIKLTLILTKTKYIFSVPRQKERQIYVVY